MKGRSLVVKLTLAFVTVGLIGALLVALLVRWGTQRAFENFIVERDRGALVMALERAYKLRGSWDGVGERLRSAQPPDNRPGEPPEDRPSAGQRLGDLFVLVDTDWRVVYSARAKEVGRLVGARERNGAQPLLVDGQVVGYLQEARPPNTWLRTTPEGAFLNRVNAAAALSAGVAVLIALAVGGFLAFTLTRSLRELQDATEALAEGDLGRQVPVRSQDELGQLGLAFNRMSADLARATQARRQMTADIAHDLRTPLAVLAGYAEALSDGKLAGSDEIFAVLEQETRYLRRLVDDLGLLSLADAGELALLRAPVDPAALVQGAARRYAVAAGERDVTLTAETAGVGAARLDADAERLAQVLDNLIGNALRYTPEGGNIVIGAMVEQETVRLWVQDSGPGIAAADLPYIFDRAYRGDAARHGGAAGLGLAIARSLVRAHGGEISVRSAPGEGALFEIVLPQAGTRKQSD